jgi:hypothetical protein
MRPGDWMPVTIEPGKYFNARPLTGFQRRDGQGGNSLHPALAGDGFEAELSQRLLDLKRACPGAIAQRRTVRMPHWQGPIPPLPEDYRFVSQPQPLATTSVTAVLVPNAQGVGQGMGFYFDGRALPSLRERLHRGRFLGLLGNLGYYMTGALVDGYPWAHNTRFPDFPLQTAPAYIGFHLYRDATTGQIFASFQGAHPGAVGLRRDGRVEVLPQFEVDFYQVAFQGERLARFEVNAVDITQPVTDVMLFTPAFQGTDHIQRLIAATEASHGEDNGWQSFRPMIPASSDTDRVNVFVANQGDGRIPVERAIAVWEGPAPLPSFGAVLSFSRPFFLSLFGSLGAFRENYLGRRVQIVPGGASFDTEAYDQIMGGLVPAVVDSRHAYVGGTLLDVMAALSRYGATSPISLCGRETQNFHPRTREPAGLLLQTESHIGWLLVDGRHELSIGASVVDAAAILSKLEEEGTFGGPVAQAVFVDGGSAMKAYHIRREAGVLGLDLLNRVAAGSRNGPGADPDGLNLYTLLKLRFSGEPI